MHIDALFAKCLAVMLIVWSWYVVSWKSGELCEFSIKIVCHFGSDSGSILCVLSNPGVLCLEGLLIVISVPNLEVFIYKSVYSEVFLLTPIVPTDEGNQDGPWLSYHESRSECIWFRHRLVVSRLLMFLSVVLTVLGLCMCCSSFSSNKSKSDSQQKVREGKGWPEGR